MDYKNWVTKPAAQIVEIIGDLSKPENITVANAVKAFAEAVHDINVHRESVTEWRYAANCFGFIRDNLEQGGNLDKREVDLLRVLGEELFRVVAGD